MLFIDIILYCFFILEQIGIFHRLFPTQAL